MMSRTLATIVVLVALTSTVDARSMSTSRDCLHHGTRDLLNRLEARWGKVTLVSTCRPGARMPSGHQSMHAVNRAFDFLPPRGKNKGEIMVWLTHNASGVVMSYRRMHHVHADTGPFRKTIYAARDHVAGDRAVAIWQEREKTAAFIAALTPLPLPRPVDPPFMVASMGDDAWREEPLAPSQPVTWGDRRDIRRPSPSGPPLRGMNITSVSAEIVFAVEDARESLIRTARAGGTMLKNGIRKTFELMHPVFVVRLSRAIEEGRVSGLPNVGCYSGYRKPGDGIGGYRNKFDSNHAYGVACDVYGIGRPGSRDAVLWHKIATKHGLYNPYYGTRATWEWNHYQATPVIKAVARVPKLRSTIKADGPPDVTKMWRVADAALYLPAEKYASRGTKRVRYAKHRKPSRYAAAG